MNKFKSYTVAIAATLPLALAAKDLKTEIKVDRTIEPVEREAARPASLTPQALTFNSNFRQLSLADYTKAAELTRTAPVLDPASYGDTLALSPYRGYASLGYFPAFNLGASAGYRFIDKTDTRLGAWLQYDGYSYKPSGDNAPDGSYSNNTVAIGATFGQRVGDLSSLGANISYSYASMGLPDNFINYKQNVNMFDGDLSWCSRPGSIGYHVDAAFFHFGFGKDSEFTTINLHNNYVIDAASENRFKFSGGVAYFGSSDVARGGIEISADFLGRSGGYEYVSPLTNKTLGIVTLLPYYSFSEGNFHGRIGAKIELSTGGEGKKFHVAPSVMLDWNATSQFAVYAKVEGGEQFNTLSSLFEYCPFIQSAWHYGRSHIPATFDLGMNFGPFTGFSAKIFGGYAIANDWLMPQLTHLYGSDNTFNNGANNFGSYKLKGFHAGLTLAYDWKSLVKASVTAETASHSADKGYYLWRDRAKYVINGDVEGRPLDKLRISVGYTLRTDRHAYNIAGMQAQPIDLGSISNLRVSATYDLTEAFSIFTRGENILNHRYDLIPDIEAQGIKGLVGVSYKF